MATGRGAAVAGALQLGVGAMDTGIATEVMIGSVIRSEWEGGPAGGGRVTAAAVAEAAAEAGVKVPMAGQAVQGKAVQVPVGCQGVTGTRAVSLTQ
jgi:hypothetical protein